MNFRTWFRKWIRSFYRLMMVGSRPHKTEKQRKKERERRLKAKYSASATLQKKKQRKRHRHSGNYKVVDALCGFIATSLGILLLPFGLFHWGYKSAKTRKSSKKNSSKNTNTVSSTVKKSVVPHKTPSPTAPKTSTYTSSRPRKKSTSAVKKTISTSSNKTAVEKKEPSITYTPYIPILETHKDVTHLTPTEPQELDENTPKSTPKNEKDQYIRKRMIIAGSSYCDSSVLAKLQVGTYFELEAEPNNPYDKDAVKLTLEGEKIGYIAKADHLAFVTCLKLRRNIYGVITDIFTENNLTKYEYETWFASHN